MEDKNYLFCELGMQRQFFEEKGHCVTAGNPKVCNANLQKEFQKSLREITDILEQYSLVKLSVRVQLPFICTVQYSSL